jgi:hypothetical protein
LEKSDFSTQLKKKSDFSKKKSDFDQKSQLKKKSDFSKKKSDFDLKSDFLDLTRIGKWRFCAQKL